MLIYAVHQSDSVTHIYTSFFPILFHYGLSQDVGDSSLCCTAGPCCLSSVFILQLASANPALPLHPPPGNHKSILCVWVCIYFVGKFIWVLFWIPHISNIIRCLSFSFWLTSPSMIVSSCKTFTYFYFFFTKKRSRGSLLLPPVIPSPHSARAQTPSLGPVRQHVPDGEALQPPRKRRGRSALRSPSARQSWTTEPRLPSAVSTVRAHKVAPAERAWGVAGSAAKVARPHLRWPRPTHSQPHLLLRDPEHALMQVVSLQRGADLSDETVLTAL